MLYLYNSEAGRSSLLLEGDDHRYIFKVRRHKLGDTIYLRNLEDGLLYSYHITAMDKRCATVSLQESRILEVKARHSLHIGWCVIDPKNIEKVLPLLNETGVSKITFIYCDRSQKSFKPDFKRFEKIVLNSSQQSGRSVMMEMETAEGLQAFLTENPQSYLLNFSDKSLTTVSGIETIVVGCEGGLTQGEVSLFAPEKVVGFDTPLVLKSESAVCAAAGKLLL